MNEIKEAIILAAGSSRRMRELGKDRPKCLLYYKEETLLERVIRQLKENEIKRIIITVGYKKEKLIEHIKTLSFINEVDIVVVENEKYSEDTNIYSLKLALEKTSGPCVIFEADTIMEDALVKYVVGSDFEGKSVWFSQSPFKQGQYGGIIKTDNLGNVINIKYVPEYNELYRDYRKLTGLMRIGPNEIENAKKIITKHASETIKQYYMNVWVENLKELPCVDGNIEEYASHTFNEPEEYIKILNREFDEEDSLQREIEFIEVEKLKHIESYDEQKVKELVEKIKQEGVWSVPMAVERNHNLVLDGQHRLEAAKRLGLRQVPIQRFDYEEVKVWTLRKEEKVDIPTVIARANSGDIYPYKTVKHKFPCKPSECNIFLSKLKGESLREIPPTHKQGFKNKRLIILAAGQGFKLDGFNKLLIKDPKHKETILDRYIKLFPDYEITVVVGYRAIEIMNQYPELNYIYNEEWRITGNSYSLALAINDRPCIVISADLLFDNEMVELIAKSPQDSVFILNSENKGLNTVRCKTDSLQGEVLKIYQGEQQGNDPETIGIFKISSPEVLKQWKKNCMQNKSSFAGLNLPLDIKKIYSVDKKELFFHEINSPQDYINLINKLKNI